MICRRDVAIGIALKIATGEADREKKNGQAAQPIHFTRGQETRESETFRALSEVGHHCLMEIWLRQQEILE